MQNLVSVIRKQFIHTTQTKIANICYIFKHFDNQKFFKQCLMFVFKKYESSLFSLKSDPFVLG